MNCTLCMTTDTTFDELLFQNTTATENIYTTTPMPAVRKPIYERSDEEELHTSFEAAISDRLLAIDSRLSRLSNPMLDVQYAERDTNATFYTGILAKNTAMPEKYLQVMPTIDNLKPVSRFRSTWRHTTILACSAIIFVLLGFDLMGFLMLYLH